MMMAEQYTDDAACFAMGLGQLVPTSADGVVRLVCRPSFHPEVCITLTSKEVVAVALRSSLRKEPTPARMPELSEAATLPDGDFDSVCDAFGQALVESHRPPKWVVIADGMDASAVRVRQGQVERFSGHAVNDEESRFVRLVLTLALSRMKSPELCNRISWCGRYLTPHDAQEFPVTEEPSLPSPKVCRVLVIGAPEDRADFHGIFGAEAVRGRTT